MHSSAVIQHACPPAFLAGRSLAGAIIREAGSDDISLTN